MNDEFESYDASDADDDLPHDEGYFVLLSIFAFFGAIGLLIVIGLLAARFFGPIN